MILRVDLSNISVNSTLKIMGSYDVLNRGTVQTNNTGPATMAKEPCGTQQVILAESDTHSLLATN